MNDNKTVYRPGVGRPVVLRPGIDPKEWMEVETAKINALLAIGQKLDEAVARLQSLLVELAELKGALWQRNLAPEPDK